MVIEKRNGICGIDAMTLRWLAMVLMLLDHIWLTLLKPDCIWLTYLGRVAFPIFAFQIAEGCAHTSNFKRYALRLGFFALLSEIPYNMLRTGMGGFFALQYQNVMFTLLIGLLTLRLLLWAKDKTLWHKLFSILVFAIAYQVAVMLHSDYGGIGVTVVVMFGLTNPLRRSRLIQLICLTLLMAARVTDTGSWGNPYQMFAVLAMGPIFLYNGTAGSKNKILQYGAYLFYPAHISVLVILRYLAVKYG